MRWRVPRRRAHPVRKVGRIECPPSLILWRSPRTESLGIATSFRQRIAYLLAQGGQPVSLLPAPGSVWERHLD